MNIHSDLTLKSLKGMQDILPPYIESWHYLEDRLRHLTTNYGYDEVRFPILEKTNLFLRSLGHRTDLVEKEMFTFNDRDKAQTLVSLRPEGTVGCVRACLENGLLRNNQHQKLWYLGPMFRRENPQKGRYRQFHQFGVESFGFKDPQIEAEHIVMMHRLWKNLGISSFIRLEINTLGTFEERAKYRDDLQKYFEKNEHLLDEDSKRRLTTNPLRILDSKNSDMEEVIQNAPTIFNYLGNESTDHFESLKSQLDTLEISYTANPKVVRGLDYYSSTVYEWKTDKLGAQSEVCSGGRYDGLVNMLGGDEAYGVGFGMGVERILLLLEQLDKKIVKNLDGFLMGCGDVASHNLLLIAEKIRSVLPQFKLLVNCGDGSMKSQFKKADKSGAKLALIIGEDEINNGCISIKFLREEREQLSVPMEDLVNILGGL